MSKVPVGEFHPARFNVFEPDGMMVHDAGSCEFTQARAAELARAVPGRAVTPASGDAARVDAAIRLAARDRHPHAAPGAPAGRRAGTPVTENISSWLDVVYAANLKPGDRLAGYYVPDAPTRPVQPNARALTLTEVARYDDNGKAMMRLRSGDLNLSPARAMANALVIRMAEHPAEEPAVDAGQSAGQSAVDPSAAETGRYIVMRLLQLEERLAAHHPRAARDGHVASIISTIRDEAGALTERFEDGQP
jgi:hypothetical protein